MHQSKTIYKANRPHTADTAHKKQQKYRSKPKYNQDYLFEKHHLKPQPNGYKQIKQYDYYKQHEPNLKKQTKHYKVQQTNKAYKQDIINRFNADQKKDTMINNDDRVIVSTQDIKYFHKQIQIMKNCHQLCDLKIPQKLFDKQHILFRVFNQIRLLAKRNSQQINKKQKQYQQIFTSLSADLDEVASYAVGIQFKEYMDIVSRFKIVAKFMRDNKDRLSQNINNKVYSNGYSQYGINKRVSRINQQKSNDNKSRVRPGSVNPDSRNMINNKYEQQSQLERQCKKYRNQIQQLENKLINLRKVYQKQLHKMYQESRNDRQKYRQQLEHRQKNTHNKKLQQILQRQRQNYQNAIKKKEQQFKLNTQRFEDQLSAKNKQVQKIVRYNKTLQLNIKHLKQQMQKGSQQLNYRQNQIRTQQQQLNYRQNLIRTQQQQLKTREQKVSQMQIQLTKRYQNLQKQTQILKQREFRTCQSQKQLKKREQQLQKQYVQINKYRQQKNNQQTYKEKYDQLLMHKLIDTNVLIKLQDKLYLKQIIQQQMNSQIKQFQLLHKYDPSTPNKDIHKYIDGHPNVMIIIQLKSGLIIGGFSQAPFSPQRQLDCVGILFSITKRRYFLLKNRKQKPAILYNPYFITYGNEQLRIKVNHRDTKSVHSSFGTAHGYFHNRNQNRQILLGNQPENAQFVDYEIIQVKFND